MINILIHILPQEIDQLEQTLIQLKKSSKYISDEQFSVEVVLNCNLTDWENSKIDKQFFINKLKNYEHLTQSWATPNFWVSQNEEILGCTDLHRRSGRMYSPDAFIWLDVDIIFSDTLLYNIVEAHKIIKDKEKYFIITPETTRLWDTTWDGITNENALIEDASHNNYFSRDPYMSTGLVGDPSITKIDQFKFASGWFTFLSTELVKKVDIPNKMGAYYMDDTFIMECCRLGKMRGFNANQYLINNEVIIENNLFRYNPYKNYLINIDRKDDFIHIAKSNFVTSVNDFLIKI